MYRKRRLFYIVMFIFIPCVILPLIYLTAYFEKFKNGVFNEVSFSAKTSLGESIDLSSHYDFKNKIYEVKVPIGIDLTDIVVNSADNGDFEIDDVTYTNGSVLTDIHYDNEYDIKMYTYDGKLLNEGLLVFVRDSETVMMNFDDSNENVSIISTTDKNNLPEPMLRGGMQMNEKNKPSRPKISAYAKFLTVAFGACWLYLLYKILKNNGFFVRRRKKK